MWFKASFRACLTLSYRFLLSHGDSSLPEKGVEGEIEPPSGHSPTLPALYKRLPRPAEAIFEASYPFLLPRESLPQLFSNWSTKNEAQESGTCLGVTSMLLLMPLLLDGALASFMTLHL